LEFKTHSGSPEVFIFNGVGWASAVSAGHIEIEWYWAEEWNEVLLILDVTCLVQDSGQSIPGVVVVAGCVVTTGSFVEVVGTLAQ